MAGTIGDALLRLMGQQDPRAQAAAALLGPAAGAGTPGTPGGVAPPAGSGAPAGQPAPAPATPQAYNSPPDLLSLYSQLTNNQNKVNGINRGIDLIAAGFASPQNRSSIMQMAGGVGSDNPDPLTLVQTIQKQQQAQADRASQLSALPEIAQKYGLSIGTAKQLWSTGKLDEYITQQDKPDRTTMADSSGVLHTINQATGTEIGAPIGTPKVETMVVTDPATGIQRLVNKNTGQDVANLGGGLAPSTQVVKDDSTGKQTLIDQRTGKPIADVGGGLAPTSDEQNLDRINQDRIAKGEQPYTLDQWTILKSKSGASNVNVNTADGSKHLLEGLDTDLLEQKKGAEDAAASVGVLQNARSSLNAPGGVIAGSKTSVPETEGRKLLANLFGYDDDGVTNTENYLSNVKELALKNIKSLGTGNSITDTDRDYVSQMVGASQDMPVASIRQIFRIRELANRNQIIDYNSKVADRLAASAGADGQPDPALVKVLKPLPVPSLSDDVMNMVDPEDLKTVASYVKSGKPAPASFIRQFENGDPSKNIGGYGAGSYQAVLDRVKGS